MSELGQFRFPTVHETWVKRGKDPTIHATAQPVRTEFDVTTTTSLFQVPSTQIWLTHAVSCTD